MNEDEIQQLLEEADQRGYDTKQKEELVQFYLDRQKPQEASNTDDYLASKYAKPTETPMQEPEGAITQLGKSAWSTLVDQVPASLYKFAEKSIGDTNYENNLYDMYLMSRNNQNGGDIITDPYDQRLDELRNPIEKAKIIAKEKERLGLAEYLKQKNKFEESNKAAKLHYRTLAKEQEAEGAEKTKNLTTKFADVHNIGDAIRYGASSVGEAIGSSIPALLTGGISAYAQESGEAYDESVKNIAEGLTYSTGKDWTPEEVKDLGYDKPAQQIANVVGAINMGLEMVGIESVFRPAAKRIFVKKATQEIAKLSTSKPILKEAAKGIVGEGVTEFLQESVTQYGALKAAGHTDDQIFGADGEQGLFDWKRSIEAGVRGGIGGGAIGGTSAKLSSLGKETEKLDNITEKANEKLAEKDGTLEAKLDKADAIANEASDESINDGTEEDIDEFYSSIKDLVIEKEKNKEAAKIEKQLDKVDETKTKVAEEALNTIEKISEEDYTGERNENKPITKNDQESRKQVRGNDEGRKETSKQTSESSISSKEAATNRILQEPKVAYSSELTEKEKLLAKNYRSFSKENHLRAAKDYEQKIVNRVNPERRHIYETLQSLHSKLGGLVANETTNTKQPEEAKPQIEKQEKVQERASQVKNENTKEITVEAPKEVSNKIKEEKSKKEGVVESVQRRVSELGPKVKEIKQKVLEAKVEAEKLKFQRMFTVRKGMVKPSQRLQRLSELRNQIDKTESPESHSGILSRIDKEIDKLETYKEEKLAKSEKKKVKKSKEKLIEKKVQNDEHEKKVEELEIAKKEITDKYSELRDKTGRTLRRAIPIRNEKGEPLWDKNDLAQVQNINKQIDDLNAANKKVNRTSKEQTQIDSLTEEGLDEDSAESIIDPDESFDLSVEDLGLENLDQEDKAKASWKNLETVKESDYFQSVKDGMPDGLKPVWSNVIDGMQKVINQAVTAKNKTFKIFYGDSNRSTSLGEAFRNNGNFIIVLNRNNTKQGYTAHHELSHIFEFAINLLEGANDNNINNSKAFTKVNDIYTHVLNSLKKELKSIGSKNLKDLSDKQRQIVLALSAIKGEGVKFDLDRVNTLIKQLDLLTNPANISSKSESSRPLYGLYSAREMVAEAMSNEYFATLLANLDSTKSVNKKTSLLGELYDALIASINHAIDTFNNRLGYNLKHIQGFDSSYLNDILNVFNSALTNQSIGEPNIGEESTMLEDEEKSDKEINKQLSDKIFNRAVSSNISTKEDFKKLINSTEEKIGQKLSSGTKAGLSKRFNAFTKRLEFVNSKEEVLNKALATPKGRTSPDYNNLIQDFKSIKFKVLNLKDQQKYIDALIAIAGQNNNQLNASKSFIQEKTAEASVKEIISSDKGLGFREFKTGLKAVLGADKLVNLPTFIDYISRYSNEKAPILMKHFHDLIGRAFKDSSIQANDYISRLNTIALDNKLSDSNFSKIYFYGQLLSENTRKENESLEDRYNTERVALTATLKAIRKGAENTIKEKDIQDQIRQLDTIYNQLTNKEDVLTKEESNYYNEIRNYLDALTDNNRDNAEIAWGEEFIPIKNYLPKKAIGAVPMQVGSNEENVTKSTSLKDSDLLDILHPAPQYQPLQTGQSGFQYARTGGRGVYYDTNIHSVMAKYLHSTLFSINASYDVQKLNKMFKGGLRDQLDDTLGYGNTERLLTFLKNSLNHSGRGKIKSSDFTKLLLDAKNTLQTAKIGTSGQFFNQYVAMLPATLALTGAKAFGKAIRFQMKLYSDPTLRSDFDQLVGIYSSQLGIRDFFWEKYETAEDVAKEGVASRFKRATKKIEDNTVTRIMSSSDKYSTQLTFLAAFIEAGGDMNDRSTWTPNRIAKAELRTAELQNVSSPVFAPEALQVNSEKDALINAAFWSFKSFALNGMMNFLLATPDALKGNTEARKIATAHLASALAFEVSSLGVKAGYAAIGLGLASAFGYEPPERKKDEELGDYLSRIITNAFYSLFFGGMPTYADAGMRYLLNTTVFGEDSPLYSVKKPEELPGKAIGPFEEMYTVPMSTIDYMHDYLNDEKISDDKYYNLVGKVVAESILLTKFIPFRGDIVKTINSSKSEVSGIKRENKDIKARRNKLLKRRKQHNY